MLAGTLGGCGWIENQYTNDPAFGEDTRQRLLETPGGWATFDLRTDCLPGDRKWYPADPSKGLPDRLACPEPTMMKIVQDNDPNLRDRLQDYLFMRSDQMCERHKSGIVSTQTGVNLTLNTVTTGLSATAAIVIAPATNILAALGAIASGTRSHFNADVYQKFVAPAVLRKINDTRPEKLKEILAKRTKPPADATGQRSIASLREYTAEAAVGDVERYNQTCSFSWALASLTDSTTKFSDTAAGIEQRIGVLRKMQADNVKQIEVLKGDPKDPTGATEAVRRLHDTNSDISRQIMILQHQLLTAPQSVDPKPATSG